MKIDSFICLLMSAFLIQFGLVGCETNQAQVDAEGTIAPKPAENRYGADGQLIEGDLAPEGGGRFGFSGNANEGGGLASANKRDVRDMTPREREAAGDTVDGVATKKEKAANKAKSNSPPKPNEYKFANKVPGDPLSVTLPGKHSSLGKISIEKYDSSNQGTGQALAKGTQVTIPDPANPGQKIYFKVP